MNCWLPGKSSHRAFLGRKVGVAFMFIAQITRAATMLNAADDAFAFFAEEAKTTQESSPIHYNPKCVLKILPPECFTNEHPYKSNTKPSKVKLPNSDIKN